MKSASSLKASKIDSPKTPGGISRSLLTPCRRVGLSRNWKKSGPSPFQSPLSSSTDSKPDHIETRKRKETIDEDETTEDGKLSSSSETPTRNARLPRIKKSKTLLSALNNSSETIEPRLDEPTASLPKDIAEETSIKAEEVATPVRLKSKSKTKLPPSQSTVQVKNNKATEKENVNNLSDKIEQQTIIENAQVIAKEKSPNNLTRECIVVIQNKIFKNELKNKEKEKLKSKAQTKEAVSQLLFDSDSDDVPLIKLNKEDKPTPLIDEEDDFVETKAKIPKPTVTKSLKPKTNTKSPKSNISKTQKVKAEVQKLSQASTDDDDDFFETKRTILIRKSYDKVVKPQKAKSTGSITQKDIDELKARIEKKKKMLLAKAMTEDTQDLRDLIKKWQKGCQDALIGLMDLMKNKFPDKQNMDYSEILQTLKIPASLVGYDSDNEIFLTPNDENIILAKVTN